MPWPAAGGGPWVANYESLVRVSDADGEVIRYGGVYMKKFTFKKGDVLLSHCHVYDHQSILASGKVELWTQDNGVQTLVGPAEIKIQAGVKHALSVLEDSIWYCIHAGEDDPVTLGGDH